MINVKDCTVGSGYKVSDTGIVFKPNGDIKNTYIGSQGYLNVSINGKVYTVHRLVAEAFIPNPDPSRYTQVHHINHDKLDNRVSNLNWVDPIEHGYESNLIKKDYELLKLKDIYDISKDLILQHMSDEEIANKYNISVRTVKSIKNGDSYSHFLTDEYILEHNETKFSKKDRSEALKFIESMVLRNVTREWIIKTLIELCNCSYNEAAYLFVYSWRKLSKKYPDKRKYYDKRYKYTEYMKYIEEMLLEGKPTLYITCRLREKLDIPPKKLGDLVRQRLKALLTGNSIIDCKDDHRVQILREAHDAVVARRKKMPIMTKTIDTMLEQNKSDEEIIEYIRSTGLYTGEYDMRQRLSARKCARKKRLNAK